MTSWYGCIEPEIRKEVKLLRDNGFNTISSCEHSHEIECIISLDGELKRLHDLLFNSGYRNFSINLNHKVVDGHIYSYLVTSFDKNLR